MTAFDSFFSSVGLPALTAEIFGQAASYQAAAGGAPVSCYVVVTHDVVIQPTSYDSTTVITGTTIEALVSAVPSVSVGDVFTVGAASYTCKKELENNGSITKWVVHG